MGFSSLFNAAKALGGNMISGMTQYIPAELSEDKRFANAYAAILASLVTADFIVEEAETIGALQHIQGDADLVSNNLVSHTLGFYAQFIEEYSACNGEVTKVLVLRAQILEKHVRCVANGNHRFILDRMARSVAGRGNAQEKQALSEIQSMLV